MALRFTLSTKLVMAPSPRPEHTMFTSIYADFVGKNVVRRQLRVTAAYAQWLGITPQRQSLNAARFTGAYMQVLSHWTPNFEWIDMFIYEEFPYDISYNSIGATRFATDVVVVDSGDDQRVSRWSQPLMEYDVAYGVRTMEHLHGLIAFFRAMQGKRNGFLYHDPVDHSSTMATRTEARAAPSISARDQIIGTGDGSTKTFQLIKTYLTLGGQTHVRPITKPKGDTVLVAINGVDVTNWNVDATKGKITFTSPMFLNSLPQLSLVVRDDGALIVTGSGSCFSALQVGKRIIMYGWVNPQNNTTERDTVTVEAKPDNNTIVLRAPLGVGSPESNHDGVKMYVHPAPDYGVTITAGYEFWVPVRFDTDRLPVTLEEYGVGGAADVKLIEIRPGEAL